MRGGVGCPGTAKNDTGELLKLSVPSGRCSIPPPLLLPTCTPLSTLGEETHGGAGTRPHLVQLLAPRQVQCGEA